MSLPETKVCTKCHEEKSATEFYLDFRGTPRAICKICHRTANNARRRSNPEAHRATNLEYYYANKERLNKERRSKWSEVYLANKDRYLSKQRKYSKENPESVRRYSRTRRARKLGNGYEPYLEQDIFDRWGTDCHLCGEPVDLEAPRRVGATGWERGLHLEHVVSLSSGGSDTVDNVKPSHGLCNLRKGY